MASKKDTHALVLAAVTALCALEKVGEDFTTKVTDVLNNTLAPKSGGATVNISEVYNEEDDTILCSVSGVWLPATEVYFYAEKAEGKGIKGLKRVSKQGESVRKSATKVLAATEKAIMTDVLSGEMTPEDGQAKLLAAKAIKPDYSSVSI